MQRRVTSDDRIATRLALVLAGTLAYSIAAEPAHAGIVATSGSVTEIVVTGSEDFSDGGPFETGAGAAQIFVFEEAQTTSVTNLTVDLQPSDATTNWSPGDPATPVQLTGTISSHYVHFDTVNGVTVSLAGFVEFDAPILGLIVETASHDASDTVVGSSGMTFEATRTLGPLDALRVEAMDRRLVFDFENFDSTDQIRVITGTAVAADSITTIVVTGGEAFVEGGAYEGDGQGINTVYFFAEQAGIDVTNLGLDLDATSLQSGWAHPDATQPATVSDRVDSYYLFFDSVDDSQTTLISGKVTFPTPVLGVIFQNGNLVASDALLGVSGVSFAGTRQLGTLGDEIELDGSGLELSFAFSNVSATDDIRIVTVSAAAVPGLGLVGLALLAMLLLGFGMRTVRSSR